MLLAYLRSRLAERRAKRTEYDTDTAILAALPWQRRTAMTAHEVSVKTGIVETLVLYRMDALFKRGLIECAKIQGLPTHGTFCGSCRGYLTPAGSDEAEARYWE